MTGARIRLVLAALAFFGWLAWLATAVWKNGNVPVVSRAQLTAATCLVLADLTLDDQNLPVSKIAVTSVISGTGPAVGETVDVINLPKAIAAGKYATPVPGVHAIPLSKTPDGAYRIAGLPPSPGYNVTEPDRPLIYPWNEDVKKQLRSLGIAIP